MIHKNLDLQASPKIPSYTNMANLLVKNLPESERAKGFMLLVEQILPKNLIGLCDHPKPHRLVKIVCEDLACSLSQSPVSMRFKMLVAASCEAEIYEQAISSLSIAIARYAKQHLDVAEQAKDWLEPTNQQWLRLSVGELQDEASQRLQKLEMWHKWAKADHPNLWQANRLQFIHTKFNLQSVRSGCFSTAVGSLADFLNSVGAEFERLHIH